MKYFVLALVCLIWVSSGWAQEFNLSPYPTPRSHSQLYSQQATDGREGGETVEDAVPISGIPFYDTGATCDNVDDYDAICPYDDSTAPDVVYSYLPAQDLVLSFDLLGSTYDTKVYVLDSALEVVACNDDYYPDYVSLLEGVQLYAGQQYFLVIDGYGDACGNYVLNITEYLDIICDIPCEGVPDMFGEIDLRLEGEPDPGPGYIDEFNAGCGSVGPSVFSHLEAQHMVGVVTICGVTGWNGESSRDTDWYEGVFGFDSPVTIDVQAEEDTYFFILAPLDCATVAVADQIMVPACESGTLTVSGEPMTEFWLWVGPTDFNPPPMFEGWEYDYVMTLHNLYGPDIVATENATWGSVKSLYR